MLAFCWCEWQPRTNDPVSNICDFFCVVYLVFVCLSFTTPRLIHTLFKNSSASPRWRIGLHTHLSFTLPSFRCSFAWTTIADRLVNGGNDMVIHIWTVCREGVLICFVCKVCLDACVVGVSDLKLLSKFCAFTPRCVENQANVCGRWKCMGHGLAMW